MTLNRTKELMESEREWLRNRDDVEPEDKEQLEQAYDIVISVLQVLIPWIEK